MDIDLKLAALKHFILIDSLPQSQQAGSQAEGNSGKFIIQTHYVQEIQGKYPSYDDLEESEIKLGLVLNGDLFCFLMTRKVSTTCSRSARAGSCTASESSCEPDSAISRCSVLSYSCGRSTGMSSCSISNEMCRRLNEGILTSNLLFFDFHAYRPSSGPMKLREL